MKKNIVEYPLDNQILHKLLNIYPNQYIQLNQLKSSFVCSFDKIF